MSSLTYTQVCENLNNTVTLQVIVHGHKVFIDDVKIDAVINNENFRIITKQGVRMQFNFDSVLEVRPLSMDSVLPTPREIDNEYVDTDDKREAHLQIVNDFEDAMSNNKDIVITIKDAAGKYWYVDELVMPLVMSYDKNYTYIQFFRYKDLTYCLTAIDLVDNYKVIERRPLYASEEEVKTFTNQLEQHIKNRDRINIVLVDGNTQADYIPLAFKDTTNVTLFNYDTNELANVPINHIKQINKVCFAETVKEPTKVERLYNILEQLSKTDKSIIFSFGDVKNGKSYNELHLTGVFIGDATPEDRFNVDVNGLNINTGIYVRFRLNTVINITLNNGGVNLFSGFFLKVSNEVYEENIEKLENNIKNNVSSIITDVKKREQLHLRLVNIDLENKLVSGINCKTERTEARSLNIIAYVSANRSKPDHPVVEKPVQLKAGAKLGSQEPIEIPSIFTPKEEQSPYQRLSRHTRLGHFQSWMKAKTLINFMIQTPTELINKRGYVINININEITFRTLECIEITAKIDDIKNVINVTSTSKVEELEQSLIVFSINNIPVELTRRNTSNLKEQGFIKCVTGSLKNEKKIEFFNMMNSQTYEVELENILEAKKIEGSRGAELERLYNDFLNEQKKKKEDTQNLKILITNTFSIQSYEEKLRLLNKSLNNDVMLQVVLKNNKILNGRVINNANNKFLFYGYNYQFYHNTFTIEQVSSVEEIDKINEEKIKQMNMLNDSKDKKYMIKVSFNNDTNIVGYALDTSDEMNIQFGDYSTSKFHKFCLSDVTNIIIINSFFANTLISNYNKIKSAAQNVSNDEDVKCKLTCDVLRKIEYTTDINMVEELKNAYLISFNYNKKRRLVKITEIGTTFLIGYDYNTLMAAIEDKDYQIKSFTYSQMTHISVNQETDKPLDNCIKKITLINKFNEVKKTQKRKFKGLVVRLTINNNETIDCLISNINNQYVLYTNDNKCHNKYFSNNFAITKWELIDEVSEQPLKDRIKLLKENCRIAINGCKIVKVTSVFNRIYTGNVISNTDDKYITLKDGNRYISIYFKDISDFTFVENNNTELFKTLRETVNNYKLVSVKHKVTGEETVGIIVAINTQNNTFVLKNENNSYSFNIDYVTVDTNYEDKKITKIVRDNIQKVDNIQIFKDMIKNLSLKNTVINVKYGGKEYNDMYIDCYNEDTVVVYNKEGKYSSFKFSKIEALTIVPVKVEPINFDNIKVGDTCSFMYNDKQRIVTINYTDDKHINGVADNDGSIKTFSKDKITKFVKI